MTKEGTDLEPPTQKRYNELAQHQFYRNKRGAWWRMNKYIRKGKDPYVNIHEGA